MKREPKWKRLGFSSEPDYRAACTANRKTRAAALRATKVRKLRGRILPAMWDRADFHQPIVTVTRENLMSDIGCSLHTVKEAWRELKAEGSIKPIRNTLGGRNNAVTFRLCVANLPDRDTPISRHADQLKEAQDRDAAWRFLKAKFGPVKALELLDERGETPPEGAV